ncbi:hypothetical protein MMAD_12610 [Mycolicibacterium madagascariense]|uniref:Anti-sigma-D factor RsdA sigma factor binding region domain-containing protein n=1 Tax=Mycolicibacterium madagascariense TaxID=212765 RepID=A0A7I7XBE0_9MYCO|nr:anti-sigma-D factor RsdA [Mycolicibacterium madagascariense]MCV7013520.1 hypothetical protein [Mycolicibacterium madagascariense]BBZ26966.1 hypothetical protein MMAD_12610 [Mycolicibacterium madagascariense]
MPDFGRWTNNGGDPSLNEIARVDQFFEALASSQPVYSTDREEAELAFLLSGWRDDVREAPVTTPVSTGAAVDALRAGLSGRTARRSFAVVGSVAAAVLCIGGFGTAVYGSGPGDTLYGMRSAIFGQAEATRDEQVSLASAQLAQVQQLIDAGQWQQAQDKLVAVSTAVQGVGPVDQKQQLVEQWNALTYKVVEQDPAATLPPPGQPLPVLPSSPLTWLPVPTADATTSASTTSSTSATSTTSETPTSDTSPTSPTETTAPSDSSSSAATSPATSSATTTPSSPSSATPSPTSTAPSVTSPTTSSAAATPPPTSATASTAAPASTPAAPASSSASTATTTTTTTTTTTSVVEPSPPPSTSAAAPAPAPRAQSGPPSQPAERPVAPTTTTVLPPR